MLLRTVGQDYDHIQKLTLDEASGRDYTTRNLRLHVLETSKHATVLAFGGE